MRIHISPTDILIKLWDSRINGQVLGTGNMRRLKLLICHQSRSHILKDGDFHLVHYSYSFLLTKKIRKYFIFAIWSHISPWILISKFFLNDQFLSNIINYLQLFNELDSSNKHECFFLSVKLLKLADNYQLSDFFMKILKNNTKFAWLTIFPPAFFHIYIEKIKFQPKMAKKSVKMSTKLNKNRNSYLYTVAGYI